MSEIQAKFQSLLRELFQFDCADLDFGIYRIMNHKRQVIERWIEEDLPKAIEQELRQGALAEMQQAQQALEETRKKVLEALGEAAIDAEGNLAEQFHNTKVGQDYLKARERAAHVQPSEALEAAVYNHLYTFFSRYWQDGDFISKRRYSKKERYAIPYNGEEVYLYWANHDQYYVKTAEHFTDYTWKAPNGVTVHFKLQAADVEQNNVKGEKRFFLPRLDEITCDNAPLPEGEGPGVRVIIPFQYRPLTQQEEIAYGSRNQQENIIEKALEEIPNRLKGQPEALAALTAERRVDAKGNPVSYLAHHLRQYTARNTRDFFIHKDLKGFLSRELDFYLKNEVLNLDELEAAGENLAEGWFQLLRLIKRVGNHIIDFLAQIEDFQKALWEKKKFVTETFYCITVGNIPEEFYPEIAENEAQWQEWRELFRIHELPKDLFSSDLATPEGRVAFLKTHPTLVLDTRHFSPDFTDRLLASFEDLDEMTDGLLVHSENWQALNLLQEKYREQVKCIYIDPPYNTGNDEFIYIDDYQHANWLSMIYDRTLKGRELLCSDGMFFTSIGDEEIHRIRHVCDSIFYGGLVNTIVCRRQDKNLSLQFLDKGLPSLSIGFEYILVYRANKNATIAPIYMRLEKKRATKGYWKGFWNDANRPTMRYELLGVTPSTGQWKWEESKAKEAVRNYEEYIENYQHKMTLEEYWIFTGSTKRFIRRNPSGQGQSQGVEHWIPPSQTKLRTTNWTDILVLKAISNDLGLTFPSPKSTDLLQLILRMSKCNNNSMALDYFAGSGTTGHAVINLNREDGGRRKFILVEMADYFDTVLLPRIKKVTFTPEWKDGKPKRPATQEEFARGPRIVKVVRLESYEDALNNITFDEESGQKALEMFGEEYLLRYMLRWESKKSETFLDVEKLQTPFSYKLKIHRDGETRERLVDLPETFNYLIGLDVQTRRVLSSPSGRGDGGEGRYLVYRGTTREGRKVAVIWRETKGWTPEDYERDAAFVAEQKMTEGADEVYVNGDSYIPGAQSLDGLFKTRMFGNVEA